MPVHDACVYNMFMPVSNAPGVYATLHQDGEDDQAGLYNAGRLRTGGRVQSGQTIPHSARNLHLRRRTGIAEPLHEGAQDPEATCLEAMRLHRRQERHHQPQHA